MNPLSRASFAAAPIGLVGGALLMLPLAAGIEPGGWWTAAHVLWLVGYLAFMPVVRVLRSLAPSGILWTGVGVVGQAGALALIVQMVADLVAGLNATTAEQLKAAIRAFRQVPGVDLACYVVGPPLLFLSVLALVVQLAVRRTVRLLPALVAGAGMILCGIAMVAVRHPAFRLCSLIVVGIGLIGLAVAAAPAGAQTPGSARHARNP